VDYLPAVKVVGFSAAAESVLRRCAEAGVVVEFVRVVPEADEDGELAHRRAALAAVAEARRRHAGEVESNVAGAIDSRERELLAGTARRFRAEAERIEGLDPETLRGRRISAAEFFGSGYVGGTLVPDIEEHYSMFGEDLDFTRAFCDPPYGLHRRYKRLSRSDLVQLLEAVVVEVLRSPAASTEIWSWSTDWSEYFAPGREWWGAACWTLDTGPRSIVAVLASSTD
jgi:hypothetical protein